MSTPTFAKTHNLIAFLEKPSESDGFEQIVDFVNANQIKYALLRKHKPRRKETKASPIEIHTEDHVPTTSNDPLPSGEDIMQLKELMDLCINLSNKVLDLENEVIEMKSLHKAKIEKLESRVKKLEEKNMSLTKELKSFNTRVKSLTINETIMDKEESSKQGRKIANIDADAEVNLENVIEDVVKEVSEEMVEVMEIAKIIVDRVSTAGGELNAANEKPAKDKGKAKLVEEPEIQKLRKAQIALDEEVARRIETEWNADIKDNIGWNEVVEQVQSRQSDAIRKYQALKRKHVSVAQARKNMMIYLKNMAGYKIDYFKGMSYKQIRPIFGMEYKKKQKLEEQEVAKELNKNLEIVPDDKDDIFVNVTPLSSKPLTIMDYKIYQEGKKENFQIFRAHGNRQII
uniref:Uncharacterized protein n=1 Tax=Tanacetum cinerariifolium TaxID=118510 RepID=A0A699JAV3_TANCI|nr:hypothetical protein [Tanacetum cinerariifolium]